MILTLLLGCRPDPGAPRYPDPEPWTPDTGGDFYADPLDEGEERLGLGVFYEGEATETLVIDGVDRHFYIYENTFTVTTTDDRWEGYAADELTDNGVGWWGGGVHWDTPTDLRDWDALHIAIRADDRTDWAIGMTGGAEARLTVADLGVTADGEWHELEVPLTAFAGVDLSAVTVALLLVGEGGDAGDVVGVDAVYLTRRGER
jgi:hypothetical protein